MRVQLLSEDVKYDDVELSVSDHPIVLGRSLRADVQIVHPLISRLHCEWKLVDGEVVMKDLVSTNQTFLNGEPVKEAVLQPGDRVLLGDVVYVVEFPGNDPDGFPPSTQEFQSSMPSEGSQIDSEMPTTRLAANRLSSGMKE